VQGSRNSIVKYQVIKLHVRPLPRNQTTVTQPKVGHYTDCATPVHFATKYSANFTHTDERNDRKQWLGNLLRQWLFTK